MFSSNRLSVFAIGLALALALPAKGQEPVHAQDRPTQNQDAGQEPSEQPSGEPAKEPEAALSDDTPSPTDLTSPDHDGEREREERDQSQEPPGAAENFGIYGVWGDTPAQWVMAASGFLAVGVSIWAVFLLWRTLRATRDAVEEARKATATAGKAVDVTERTAQRQLRAYVTVEASVWDATDDSWCQKIEWKNTGQTPATRVLTYINWETTIDPIPDNFDYPRGNNAQRNEAASLGGGQRLECRPIFIPNETIDRIERGILRLYIWGSADYNDTFFDTPRRRTEFCYEITFDVFENGRFGIGTRIHGPHNGIDEGCYQQPQPA